MREILLELNLPKKKLNKSLNHLGFGYFLVKEGVSLSEDKRQKWHKGDERFSQWQWSCLSTNHSPRCLVGKCPDIPPVHVSLSNPSNAVKIWEIFLCGKNTNFPLSFVPFFWGSLSTITFTWTLQFPFLTFKKNLARRLSRACDELKGPSAFLCLKGFHSLSINTNCGLTFYWLFGDGMEDDSCQYLTYIQLQKRNLQEFNNCTLRLQK